LEVFTIRPQAASAPRLKENRPLRQLPGNRQQPDPTVVGVDGYQGAIGKVFATLPNGGDQHIGKRLWKDILGAKLSDAGLLAPL